LPSHGCHSIHQNTNINQKEEPHGKPTFAELCDLLICAGQLTFICHELQRMKRTHSVLSLKRLIEGAVLSELGVTKILRDTKLTKQLNTIIGLKDEEKSYIINNWFALLIGLRQKNTQL